MTLANPKPLGWAYGELLTSAQMNSFGTQLIRAVDGNGGGTYTLAAPLTLDGDTVTIAQELVAPNITGDTAFTDDVTIAGATSVAALTASGAVAAASASISGAASVTGLFSAGNVTANGTVYPTIELRLSTGGGGSYNSNVTLTVGTTPQIITIDDGDLTNNRTWTISNTNAKDGNFFLILNLSTTRSITINSPSVSPLTTVNNAPVATSDEASGTINYARTAVLLYRYASIWHFIKLQER